MPESESVQISVSVETMDRLRRLVSTGRVGLRSIREVVAVLSLASEQDVANILTRRDDAEHRPVEHDDTLVN